jgi:hypothetical protein
MGASSAGGGRRFDEGQRRRLMDAGAEVRGEGGGGSPTLKKRTITLEELPEPHLRGAEGSDWAGRPGSMAETSTTMFHFKPIKSIIS